MNNNDTRKVISSDEISFIEQLFYHYLMIDMQKEKVVLYIPTQEFLAGNKNCERFTAILNLFLANNNQMLPMLIAATLDPSDFVLKPKENTWSGLNVVEIYNYTVNEVVDKLKETMKSEFFSVKVDEKSTIPENFLHELNFEGNPVTIRMINIQSFLQKISEKYPEFNKFW